MEKTPSYWVTRSAPRRVYAMNPSVKLLAVVRDPVTRAISDYTQSARYVFTTTEVLLIRLLLQFKTYVYDGSDYAVRTSYLVFKFENKLLRTLAYHTEIGFTESRMRSPTSEEY